MFAGTVVLFRGVPELALGPAGYPAALAHLVLHVLPCGIAAGFCLHIALHGRGAVTLGPDDLDVVLVGERKRCRWSEVAGVNLVEDGARPVGVQILVRMPSGASVVWLTISNYYRIDHRALREAIETARQAAMVRDSGHAALGPAAAAIIASQNRLTYWIASIAIYLPFVLLALYLLAR